MSWNLDNEGFHLAEPLRYRPWYNYLSNGDYGIKISHLGDGYASTLVEPRVVVTNYDFFTPNRGRFLYIKTGEDLWNPSFYPTGTSLDKYSCTHSPGYTSFRAQKGDIEATSTHFLPERGAYEIWKVQVENLGSQPQRVEISTLAEFLLYDNMGIDPVYFSWFTNSRFNQEKNQLEFFRTDQKPVFGFFRGIQTPDSTESSLIRWQGNGDYRDPESLKKETFSNAPAGGDPYTGCFRYAWDLGPGEKKELAFFIGTGEEAAEECTNTFPHIEAVNDAFEKTKTYWKEQLSRREWEQVQDPQLKAYLQTFFPYQIIQQSTGMVRSTFRGYRDVAQDAVGLSFFDPAGAADLIRTLCTKMMSSGRCLRQWNTGGGFNDERDFRDLPLWLPIAVERYLDQRDEGDFLSESHPFFDSEETGTVWDHMVRGLEYVLQYGPHDLIRIGVGDWNDALSGLGHQGESLWLNQIAYLSLSILEKLANRYKLPLDLDINAHKSRLYQGVIKGWNGEWFLRGYTEKGEPVGDEDRIFLLPQAWFTISGMADEDPQKGSIALKNMVQKLRNDNGLLICHPGFEEYDEKVGNLSCLAPGMAENFAVYNHASAFGVYALYKGGMKEEAQEFMKKLLPFTKEESRTMAEPYVLVNYYNGGYYEEQAGRGGVPWLTGTVHWLALSLFDFVLSE